MIGGVKNDIECLDLEILTGKDLQKSLKGLKYDDEYLVLVQKISKGTRFTKEGNAGIKALDLSISRRKKL